MTGHLNSEAVMSTMTEDRCSGPGWSRGSFPEEFEADAVALLLDEGRSIASMARSLGIGESNLRRWVRQARVERGERKGLTSGQRAELARLRMERDLLEGATALWVAASGL